MLKHPAEGEIVEEGQAAAGFHLILDGSGSVLQAGEVRGNLRARAVFGEISLIDGQPRSATIRTNEVTRTLSLPAWNFGPLLDAHPSMARKLLVGLRQIFALSSPHLVDPSTLQACSPLTSGDHEPGSSG